MILSPRRLRRSQPPGPAPFDLMICGLPNLTRILCGPAHHRKAEPQPNLISSGPSSFLPTQHASGRSSLLRLHPTSSPSFAELEAAASAVELPRRPPSLEALTSAYKLRFRHWRPRHPPTSSPASAYELHPTSSRGVRGHWRPRSSRSAESPPPLPRNLPAGGCLLTPVLSQIIIMTK
jgi:hypothetical protein